MKKYTVSEIVNDYEYLGSGFSAQTHLKDANHVFRISITEKDGWRALCFMTPEERERFSLPRIKRWWIDPKTEYLIAVVERLNRLTWEDYKDNPIDLEKFNRHFLPPDVDNLMAPDNVFYESTKKAVALYHHCNTTGLNIVALDMNYRNIMKRDDGTFVLNDVLGARDI